MIDNSNAGRAPRPFGFRTGPGYRRVDIASKETTGLGYAAESSYALVMPTGLKAWLKRPVLQASLIAAFILILALVTIAVPSSDLVAHNVLHHLNFLPLMLAGMLFGWRGAVLAGLFSFLTDAPVIAAHWKTWPLDAKDQVLELSIFSVAGLIAGILSDHARSQRRNLEKTQMELERVYTELRESIESMRKAERLSAAGQLAASLAHEIRNPLASISGAAGILRRGTAAATDMHDCLSIIDKESQRLNKLLTGFLNFAKPRSPRVQCTDPNGILLSVASLALHTADANHISLRYETLASCPEVECDPEQLQQVLLNLLINAIEASPAGATIWIRSAVQQNKLAMEIEDQGNGISEEHLEHIFDPFFTTKPKGTGLGLAISSMIIAQHGGSLTFRSNPASGTTFRVELPLNVPRNQETVRAS
jgi:two-component system, NtrC family, sensor histidine kinase HydH